MTHNPPRVTAHETDARSAAQRFADGDGPLPTVAEEEARIAAVAESLGLPELPDLGPLEDVPEVVRPGVRLFAALAPTCTALGFDATSILADARHSAICDELERLFGPSGLWRTSPDDGPALDFDRARVELSAVIATTSMALDVIAAAQQQQRAARLLEGVPGANVSDLHRRAAAAQERRP